MSVVQLRRKKLDPVFDKQMIKAALVQASLSSNTEMLHSICKILCEQGIRLKDLEFAPQIFQLIGDKITESGFTLQK